ncbi:MAG: hypothetical protein MUF64_30070, partial [Polyangiaceae bacterium]|nr:hypothetical protein [Polyangiaceae bacterium]
MPKALHQIPSPPWTPPPGGATTPLVRDALVTLGLSLGFALALTGVASIAYGLLWRPPRWRALLPLVFPPLAPLLAVRERM